MGVKGVTMKVNTDKIDDMVLALMYLTSFGDGNAVRSWKGYDWDSLNRLYEKGMIGNPVGKSKSVVFSDEGAQRAKELFEQVFCQRKPSHG